MPQKLPAFLLSDLFMRIGIFLALFICGINYRVTAQSLGNCDSTDQFQMYLSDVSASMQANDFVMANDSNIVMVGYRGSGAEQNGFISSINTKGKVNWAVHSGGNEEDGYYCIVRDQSGSMYVGGYTWSATSGRAAVMAKYLANGSLVWRKIYGFGREYIYRVNISNNRQFVYFTGLSIDNSFGSEDFTVYKIDTNGNMQWAKQCGNNELNRSHNLLEAGIGNDLYVVGTTGDPYPIIRGNITKLDASGHLLWSKKYQLPTDYQVAFYDIKKWNDDLIVYGYLGLNNGSTTSVNKEVMLARLDHDGNVKWAKKYTFDYAIPWQFQIVGNQILLSGGNATKNGDGFLILADSNGNVIQSKLVGSGDNESIVGLRTSQQNEVYFAGYKRATTSVAWFGKAGCKLSLPCDASSIAPSAQNITLKVSNETWSIQDFEHPVNFTLTETAFSPNLNTICKSGKKEKQPCDEDSVKNTHINCTCPVFIPSAFSPGRSPNLNDKLVIAYTCPYARAVVRIYNRWGQKIFESADSTLLWDGYYQEKPVPAGAYFCVVSIQGVFRGMMQEFMKNGLVYVVE